MALGAIVTVALLARARAQEASGEAAAIADVTSFFDAVVSNRLGDRYRLSCAADRDYWALEALDSVVRCMAWTGERAELAAAARELRAALGERGLDPGTILTANDRGVLPEELLAPVKDVAALLDRLTPAHLVFQSYGRVGQEVPRCRVVDVTLHGAERAVARVAWASSQRPSDPPDEIEARRENGRWRVDLRHRDMLRSANTAAAINALTDLRRCVMDYLNGDAGVVPDLAALLRAADRERLEPEHPAGYRFTYRASATGWFLLATPIVPGRTGIHYLGVDHTEVVRYSAEPFHVNESTTSLEGGTPIGQ